MTIKPTRSTETSKHTYYTVSHPEHSDLYFSSHPLLLNSDDSLFHNLISIANSYSHRGQVISTIRSHSGAPGSDLSCKTDHVERTSWSPTVLPRKFQNNVYK